MEMPKNPYHYPQYTEKEAYARAQKEDLRWFVGWAEGDCDCGRMANFARVFCKYCWKHLKDKLAEGK